MYDRAVLDLYEFVAVLMSAGTGPKHGVVGRCFDDRLVQ